MTYIKPQVLIHQEFSQPTNSDDTTLRAMIVGPNAVLHRYSDPDEKALISLGKYIPSEYKENNEDRDTTYDLKTIGVSEGGIVDEDSATLYVDDALVTYYKELENSGSDGSKPVRFTWSGVEPNIIVSEVTDFNFATNGDYSRAPALPRDVQPGDYVWLRCRTATPGSACGAPTELVSKIVGLAPELTESTISEAADTAGAIEIKGEPTTSSTTEVGSATPSYAGTYTEDAPTLTLSGEAGFSVPADTTYTIEVDGVTPVTVKIKVNDGEYGSPVSASDEFVIDGNLKGTLNITNENITVGDKWTVVADETTTITPGAAITTAQFSVDYDLEDSTAATLSLVGDSENYYDYNHLVAGCADPEFTILVKNIATSSQCVGTIKLEITGKSASDTAGFSAFSVDKTVNIVSGDVFELGYGLKCALTFETEKLSQGDKIVVSAKIPFSSATLTTGGTYIGEVDDTYTVEVTRGGELIDSVRCPLITIRSGLGLDYVVGRRVVDSEAHAYGISGITLAFDKPLYTGQKFTFNVTSENNGPVTGLILQKNLPSEMQSPDVKLDIRLMDKRNLSLKAYNPATPDLPVFTVYPEADSLKVEGEIIINDPEYTDSVGTMLDMELFAGELYFEFREWVQDSVGEMKYCDSVDSLSFISGQLSPENPLKYAVYKALSNSNGVPVAYTAVRTPDDMDAWQEAFGIVEGSEDVYSITPASQDIRVLNIAAATIAAESGVEQCRWKSGVFSVKGENTRMLVGQNLVNNNIFTTSTDGKAVIATIKPYSIGGVTRTRVDITSGNATFKDENNDKIRPGDELRIIQSSTNYISLIIDEVISEESLYVTTNPYDAENSGQKIEVWHKMTKNEQVDYFGTIASSFNSRRISVVFPDVVGEDNMELPGYYLAAAVSGYKAGINAYQGMTRTEIVGFDDFRKAKPYFTESQLNKLAEYGVFIVLSDANGTAYIRHALTTDMATTAEQEEVITRDYDYICKGIHSLLNKYIGRYNATSTVFRKIRRSLEDLLDSYKSNGYITSYSDLKVQSHALLADRVEVYVTVGLPFPINNIEVYVSAQKG